MIKKSQHRHATDRQLCHLVPAPGRDCGPCCPPWPSLAASGWGQLGRCTGQWSRHCDGSGGSRLSFNTKRRQTLGSRLGSPRDQSVQQYAALTDPSDQLVTQQQPLPQLETVSRLESPRDQSVQQYAALTDPSDQLVTQQQLLPQLETVSRLQGSEGPIPGQRWRGML
ncbi:hypothetical protein RRG08_060987 [Elysia crispata]|uniref:Uncharacterized protein n=1 Tax=Elysia crispata TaxID=231223 RepID=A0AAE1AUT5_9GAST|nr:hypothetical protein RRG08_060987 [Elysia crispata]